MSDGTDRDAVGYGSPPKHSQFQPGRSGNPAGRPRHRPSFRAALLAELAATMPGMDQRARSKLQLLVKVLVDSAVAGNARAQFISLGSAKEGRALFARAEAEMKRWSKKLARTAK
jgi:Family of unknown function (DUF5681)